MTNYLFWKRFAQGKLKTHVSSLKVRIPSPKEILSWSERRLPNTTLVGKVDNAHTVEHDTLRPVSGGLFCERIFGPIATNVCACLRKKGWNEDYCKICEVQFTKSRLRRYQMGHILLAAPVIHVWALQGGYLASLLGKKNFGIRSIAYGKVMSQSKLFESFTYKKKLTEITGFAFTPKSFGEYASSLPSFFAPPGRRVTMHDGTESTQGEVEDKPSQVSTTSPCVPLKTKGKEDTYLRSSPSFAFGDGTKGIPSFAVTKGDGDATEPKVKANPFDGIIKSNNFSFALKEIENSYPLEIRKGLDIENLDQRVTDGFEGRTPSSSPLVTTNKGGKPKGEKQIEGKLKLNLDTYTNLKNLVSLSDIYPYPSPCLPAGPAGSPLSSAQEYKGISNGLTSLLDVFSLKNENKSSTRLQKHIPNTIKFKDNSISDAPSFCILLPILLYPSSFASASPCIKIAKGDAQEYFRVPKVKTLMQGVTEGEKETIKNEGKNSYFGKANKASKVQDIPNFKPLFISNSFENEIKSKGENEAANKNNHALSLRTCTLSPCLLPSEVLPVLYPLCSPSFFTFGTRKHSFTPWFTPFGGTTTKSDGMLSGPESKERRRTKVKDNSPPFTRTPSPCIKVFTFGTRNYSSASPLATLMQGDALEYLQFPKVKNERGKQGITERICIANKSNKKERVILPPVSIAFGDSKSKNSLPCVTNFTLGDRMHQRCKEGVHINKQSKNLETTQQKLLLIGKKLLKLKFNTKPKTKKVISVLSFLYTYKKHFRLEWQEKYVKEKKKQIYERGNLLPFHQFILYKPDSFKRISQFFDSLNKNQTPAPKLPLPFYSKQNIMDLHAENPKVCYLSSSSLPLSEGHRDSSCCTWSPSPLMVVPPKGVNQGAKECIVTRRPGGAKNTFGATEGGNSVPYPLLYPLGYPVIKGIPLVFKGKERGYEYGYEHRSTGKRRFELHFSMHSLHARTISSFLPRRGISSPPITSRKGKEGDKLSPVDSLYPYPCFTPSPSVTFGNQRIEGTGIENGYHGTGGELVPPRGKEGIPVPLSPVIKATDTPSHPSPKEYPEKVKIGITSFGCVPSRTEGNEGVRLCSPLATRPHTGGELSFTPFGLPPLFFTFGNQRYSSNKGGASSMQGVRAATGESIGKKRASPKVKRMILPSISVVLGDGENKENKMKTQKMHREKMVSDASYLQLPSAKKIKDLSFVTHAKRNFGVFNQPDFLNWSNISNLLCLLPSSLSSVAYLPGRQVKKVFAFGDHVRVSPFFASPKGTLATLSGDFLPSVPEGTHSFAPWFSPFGGTTTKGDGDAFTPFFTPPPKVKKGVRQEYSFGDGENKGVIESTGTHRVNNGVQIQLTAHPPFPKSNYVPDWSRLCFPFVYGNNKTCYTPFSLPPSFFPFGNGRYSSNKGGASLMQGVRTGIRGNNSFMDKRQENQTLLVQTLDSFSSLIWLPEPTLLNSNIKKDSNYSKNLLDILSLVTSCVDTPLLTRTPFLVPVSLPSLRTPLPLLLANEGGKQRSTTKGILSPKATATPCASFLPIRIPCCTWSPSPLVTDSEAKNTFGATKGSNPVPYPVVEGIPVAKGDRGKDRGYEHRIPYVKNNLKTLVYRKGEICVANKISSPCVPLVPSFAFGDAMEPKVKAFTRRVTPFTFGDTNKKNVKNAQFTGPSVLSQTLKDLNLVLLDRLVNWKWKVGKKQLDSFLLQNKLTKKKRGLRNKLAKTKIILTRRKKLIQSFLNTKQLPEWMILSVLPVLPPALRPILELEPNNVVVSDLNTLYQTVIRRNDALMGLLTFRALEIDILNRQVSLQQAIEKLFDKGAGTKKRPVKSLSQGFHGKRGLFRLHLLGKRVDYSGRSVIVVGPRLKLHECGLPKEMALVLFLPFLIARLKRRKVANNTSQAKQLIIRKDKQIWSHLKALIYEHPVLLNRAPTLHRLGFQAFQPILVSGKAIILPALVCTGFNADFDGDQMAVHVPLSYAARAESWKLLYAKNNMLSPATGKPIIVLSQEMILGCYCSSLVLNKTYFTSSPEANTFGALRTRTSLPSLRTPCIEDAPPLLLKYVVASHRQGRTKANEGEHLGATKGVKNEGGKQRGKEAAFKFYKKNKYYFTSFQEVHRALNHNKIALQTAIWLRIASFEDNQFLEEPLEIRLDAIGHSFRSYGQSQRHFSRKTKSQNQLKGITYVRTSAGRIQLNEIFYSSLSV